MGYQDEHDDFPIHIVVSAPDHGRYRGNDVPAAYRRETLYHKQEQVSITIHKK